MQHLQAEPVPRCCRQHVVRGQACPAAQVVGRTISLQLEGSWAPVADVMVDRVGKFAYAMACPAAEPAAMPVILDVALDVRVKVRAPLPVWASGDAWVHVRRNESCHCTAYCHACSPAYPRRYENQLLISSAPGVCMMHGSQ